MERKIALISEKHLKEASVIELNTDNKILSKLIIDSQKIFLRPILGKTLYDELLEEVYLSVQDEEHVFNPDLKELLDTYIQPYLVYCVLIDFIVVNQYKITNKGLLKINDTGATTITPEELAFAKNQFDNKMIAYKSLLLDYLKDKYPVPCNSSGKISTATDTTGWYLDGFKSVK